VTTALSSVDGAAGVLAYRGMPLEQAVRLRYPAAAALLLGGDPAGADDVDARLFARPLPAEMPQWATMAGDRPPMARLRMIAALLHRRSPDPARHRPGGADDNYNDDDDDIAWAGCCVRALAAVGPRAQAGHPPATDTGFAGTVLAGVADVDAESAALLDTCFVVHLDHALNPSTLAVRVAASVGSSLSACFDVGLGTLEGPLHGGASTAVGALLDTIERPGDVDAALDDRAARRSRVPGFGHPVYRTKDPRAAILRALCERAAVHRREHRYLDVALRIEEFVRTRSQGRLFANVDFYAAALYATLGVPLAWHTPLFFAARALGWVAHIREQRARGRVLSPEAGYDGPPVASST
jgi:citrate synthase